MNTCLFASVENSWLLAGWTMIHFLWLGTLVALAGLLNRWLLRRTSANVRYMAALTCLATLAALPIAIATWLHVYSPSVEAANRPLQNGVVSQIARTEQGGTIELKNIESMPLAIPSAIGTSGTPISAQSAPRTAQPIDLPVAGPLPVTSAPAAADPLSLAVFAINFSVRYLPWLWLIGTPLTFALTATGLLGGRRLRRASRPITDGPIAEALEKLAASLRLSRRVAVAVCDRIAAPVLIGILRPIILLPPAALTGYSPDEIEMVLLHELAHVRRWDNLVNLIQRLLESLLFFHPAVWLISSWIRRERESCCDALVVTRTDRPYAYAELLVALAAQMPRSVLFHPAASSAMAAGPLRSRIRRILQLDDDPMLISGKSFVLVLGTLLVAATLAVLYVPSIGQAEQPTTEAADGAKANSNAAAEAQTKNNLKNLCLALQNYHETRKLLPAHAIYDAKGLPLLSWRVQILPFLDEPKLYQEFHLDEPWDSEHNRKLIARMPAVFKNPKLNKPGLTNYLAVVGEECIFNGSPKALGFKHVTDGTSNTIALVEANIDLAVEWTKPQDWNFNRALPTEGLGQLWPGGWYAAWVDGSVRRIANSEPADRVGIQFTRAGGETHSLQESADRLLAGGAAVAEQAVGLEGGPSAESPPEALPKVGAGNVNAKAGEPPSADSKPLLARLGIDPTKEPGDDDAKNWAELFRSAGVVNPVESRTYDVPVDGRKTLQIALDSINHGPLIKHMPFESKWDDSHAHITITAPKLALGGFFDPIVHALEPRRANETILLTLPDNWDNSETNPQLMEAIAYADKRNLRLERSSRDGKPVLVGTPLPTESEWLAILGEPPQKDRVIAEKAWQRLGLKLLPISDVHPGLRIIGGNLPKGLPRYAFLEFVEGVPITTLDELLSWLESESGRSDKSVKCYAMSNQKEYLFYAKPTSSEVGDKNRVGSELSRAADAAIGSAATSVDSNAPTANIGQSPLAPSSFGNQTLVESRIVSKARGADAGTELLLREIAEIQKKKSEIQSQLYQAQTDYLVAKSELTDPKLEKSQKSAAKIEQLTNRFKINFVAMQEQLNTLEKSREEHLKSLKDRNSKSVDVEIRDSVANHGRTLAEIEAEFAGTRPKFDNDDQRRKSFLKWMFTITDANPLETKTYNVPSDLRSKFGSRLDEFSKQPGWESQFKLVADWNSDANLVTLVTTKLVHEVFAAELSSVTTTAHATGGKSSSKFPTLEEQKLADLAWKRLKLELEPLGEKDLKRIQALGYQGGLKIAGGHGDMMEQDKQILWDDILVGLHVWPVTNFANLAEVLNRNDLAELTPLKYYIVRHFDRENPPRDAVVTGRIGVTLQEERSRGSYRSRPSSSPTSSNPQTSKTSTPTAASGDAAAAAVNDIASQLDAALKPRQELEAKFNEAKSKVDAEQESVLRDMERSRQRRRDEFQSAAESTRRELEKIKPLDKNQNHFKSSYEPASKPASASAVNNTAAPTNAATSSPSAPPANAKPATAAAVPGATAAPNAEKVKVAIDLDPAVTKQETIFVAYDIPPELVYQAQVYFRKTEVSIMSDGNGRRYIVQASPAWHEHFAALLQATPKWRNPAAAKERASAAVVMKKVDGENVLEFRCIGLTFKPLAEPRNFGSPREPVALAGAAVGEVAPGSPAAWADVRPGDVLTDIGSFKAGTMPEVHSLIKALGEGLQSKQQVRFMFVREAPHGRSTVGADFTLSPEDLGGKPVEPQSSKPSTNKAAVIYEGKSFTTWQSAWQTELSTEKRVEAVKAIATFGANGFGPEAAGSILDVAGQYDWVAVVRLDHSTTFEPEGKLQRAIFGILIGAPGAVKIEPKFWLPLLRKRYEADPAKWQNAAILLLSELSRTTETQNDDVRAMLLMLAQSTNEHIASQAYDALVRRYPDNEELTKRLAKMFQDKAHWISAVRWLGWTPQYPPEVVDLLLHGNRKQQADARNTFRDVPPTPAKKALVATMIAILKDDSKTADHIAAIRALGALGPDGSFGQHEALQLLEEIVKKAPLEKKAAAAFALQYAARDKFDAIGLLQQYGGEPEGVGLNPAEAQAAFNKESEAFNGK